jgi:peptidoglycan/xylan/chitin deacetylase (PgdA/CDA1 family)
LTFHGAGDVRLAEALLREVERAGAHVTVLAVGTWLIDNPSIAARIMDGGHDLGNHTLHHRAMRTLSAAETSTEIAGCARELTRLTGSIGRWFRPSGTPRATQRILHAAAALGYRNSLAYDVDPRDYQDPSASAITNRVLDGVRAGSIVSLHLGHQNTVTALPSILDGLQQRGLRAVTTTSLLT